MRRLAPIILGLLAFVLPASSTASTTVQKLPFEADVTACSGDTIHLSGTLLATSTVDSTPSGGFKVAYHFQPQGISGVDQQTGLVYRATGLTRDQAISTPGGGSVETYLNLFHIQATQGGDSFDVLEHAHITTTPAGSVSVSFDNLSSSC